MRLAGASAGVRACGRACLRVCICVTILIRSTVSTVAYVIPAKRVYHTSRVALENRLGLMTPCTTQSSLGFTQKNNVQLPFSRSIQRTFYVVYITMV